MWLNRQSGQLTSVMKGERKLICRNLVALGSIGFSVYSIMNTQDIKIIFSSNDIDS